MIKTTYRHEPLGAADGEIRLVTVLPGDFEADIIISLRTIPLPLVRDPFVVSSRLRSSSPVKTPQGAVGLRENDQSQVQFGAQLLMDSDDDEDDGDYEMDFDDDDSGISDASNASEEHGEPADLSPGGVLAQDDYVDGYEALSYVWGSPNNPASVCVHGAPSGADQISITSNLDTALRHLRYKNASRVLWVDSVCINQNDVVERSKQVAVMARIYRLAKSVIVFLGPESDDSAYILGLLGDMGRRIVVDFTLDEIQPVRTEDAGTSVADVRQPLEWTQREVVALYHIISRAWFERLWVRQEIQMAVAAVVQCGKVIVPWNLLRNGLYRVYQQGIYGTSVGNDHARFLRSMELVNQLCRASGCTETYDRLRYSLGGIKWTDPRDAIYAIRALLHYEDATLEIIPDYTKSADVVFTDVAVRLLSKRRHLGFLGSCRPPSAAQNSSSSQQQALKRPSWVPDWSTPIYRSELGQIWSACAWISALANVEEDPVGWLSRLRAAGVLVDRVDSVVPLVMKEDVYDYRQEAVARHIRQLNPGGDLSRRYVGGGSLLEAYFRTMVRTLQPFGIDNNIRPLEILWSTTTTPSDDRTKHVVLQFLNACREGFEGRCFFETVQGYVGIGPAEMTPGDSVVVLLGSAEPIILRQASEPAHYHVVGDSFVPGLMLGEAIHGALPVHYRIEYHGRRSHREHIHRHAVGLRDARNGSLQTDPGAILEEMGIHHEGYERLPHRLEVTPGALRTAGVELCDFLLV